MAGQAESLIAPTKPRKQLGLWPLVFAFFCLVSGGPYGIEGVIGELGPSMGLMMIVLTPIIWAIPSALMTAELSAAIPAEGGYVVWVTEALGPFFGYLCAWWSWLYSIVDSAMYPVMFATYLANAVHLLAPSSLFDLLPGKVAVALGLIALMTVINILGIKEVGRASIILAVIILVPFALLIAKVGFGTIVPALAGPQAKGTLASGLAVVMWNYLGWDCLSTVSGEIKEPQKTIPRALGLSVFLVTLGYLAPILATLHFVPSGSAWQEGSWPQLATRAAGTWIGNFVLVCALASPAAMFISQMLASSRLPYALAETGMLPSALTKVSPRFGSPVRSILLCAVCYALMSPIAFKDLALANVILYGAGITLEFVALAVLRWRQPLLVRPFKIPGGWVGLALVCLLPCILMGVLVKSTVETAQPYQWIPILIALATGPVAYGISTWIRSKSVQN